MRYPVGTGTKEDFYKNWYNADPWNTWRDTYYHGGDDINKKTGGNTDCGEALYAVADGSITHVANKTTGFGKHFHLKCEGAWGTVYFHYAHCQEILVKTGDTVKEGQLIARIGSTGNSKYCHLHFEVKKKPVGVDAVARTATSLYEGWHSPLEFIDEWIDKKPENGDQGGSMYKGYDLTNAESMKVAVDVLVRVQNGEFVEKADHQEVLDLKDRYKKERDDLKKQLDVVIPKLDKVVEENTNLKDAAKEDLEEINALVQRIDELEIELSKRSECKKCEQPPVSTPAPRVPKMTLIDYILKLLKGGK